MGIVYILKYKTYQRGHVEMSEFFAHRINKQSINQAFTNSAFVVLGFSIPPPLRVEEDLAINRGL